jgi:hypothetical protein
MAEMRSKFDDDFEDPAGLQDRLASSGVTTAPGTARTATLLMRRRSMLDHARGRLGERSQSGARTWATNAMTGRYGSGTPPWARPTLVCA